MKNNTKTLGQMTVPSPNKTKPKQPNLDGWRGPGRRDQVQIKTVQGANPEFDSMGVQNGANQEANRCTSKFDHLVSL